MRSSMYWSIDLHILERDGMLRRIEVIQVSQDVAEGIPDLAIVLRDALHEFVGAAHVFAEIDGRDPQPYDLAPKLIGDINRINSVAQRLRHGAPLRIERPAIGRDAFVRGLVRRADGAEQGRVEPSAILIAALEIQIRGIGQDGSCRCVAR